MCLVFQCIVERVLLSLLRGKYTAHLHVAAFLFTCQASVQFMVIQALQICPLLVLLHQQFHIRILDSTGFHQHVGIWHQVQLLDVLLHHLSLTHDYLLQAGQRRHHKQQISIIRVSLLCQLRQLHV